MMVDDIDESFNKRWSTIRIRSSRGLRGVCELGLCLVDIVVLLFVRGMYYSHFNRAAVCPQQGADEDGGGRYC